MFTRSQSVIIAALVDPQKMHLTFIALLVASAVAMVTSSPDTKLSGYLRITNCRTSNGSRVACSTNATTLRPAHYLRLVNHGRRSTLVHVDQRRDNSTLNAIGYVDQVTTNNMTSSQDAHRAHVTRPKHRLIRGSKRAATITRKELLKTDWCQTQPFQQIVHEEGCLRSRIFNRFCYGQCNSFFIPKSEDSEIAFGDTADTVDGLATTKDVAGHFRSCAVCTPKITEWTVVVLRCPQLTPPFRRKRVRIVRQCKCMAIKLD